jgi:hypothetical protein
MKISPLTHGLRLDVGLGCCPLLEAEVEIRLWDSLELDVLDEVKDWVCLVLDEDADSDRVEDTTVWLAELVSIVELVSVVELDSIAELDGTSVLDARAVDDSVDDGSVDDDLLSIDELGEEVADIVIVEEPPREELLSRVPELMLDVLTPDSLDVGMAEVLWDSDEDEGGGTLVTMLVECSVVALPGCVLLSVESWDDVLLDSGYWLDGVAVCSDVLEVDSKSVLPCVDENWFEVESVPGVLVEGITSVENEAEFSVEDTEM